MDSSDSHGEHVQIVPPQPGVNLLGATVTPDSSFVDFVRGERGSRSLWRVPFLGGTAKRLIEDVASLPGWSPDGGKMAFVRADLLQWSRLIVADADGSHERVLVTRPMPGPLFVSFGLPGNAGLTPAWSPDGRVIALPMYDGREGILTGHVDFVGVTDGSEQVVPIHEVGTTGLAWLDGSSLVAGQVGIILTSSVLRH